MINKSLNGCELSSTASVVVGTEIWIHVILCEECFVLSIKFRDFLAHRLCKQKVS